MPEALWLARGKRSSASTVAAIRARGAAAAEALENIERDEEWSGAIDVLGSRTRFRRESSSGETTLRVDGVIDGVPLADVLAVWREVGLLSEWVPSCVESRLFSRIGRCDVLFSMGLNIIGIISRNAILHGYAVNALDEAGCVMVLAKSVRAGETPPEAAAAFAPMPSSPHVSMEYRKLQCVLEPLSQTSTRATLILSVDPKLRMVPQSLIETVLRRTICVIFWQLRRTAERIGRAEGPHAAAVEADPAFYDEWLAPMLKAHNQRLRVAGSGSRVGP
jgi:hypothetical protein